MLPEIVYELAFATGQTLYMVSVSGLLATLIGLPCGLLLRAIRQDGLLPQPRLHRIFSLGVDALRSLPFIILLVLIIPLTRLITGTSIGTTAAIVPLTLSAIPFMARMTDNALNEVPKGLSEAGIAMGAAPWQIMLRILLPEALPAIINGITLMLIALVGYAAMAGAIGGGGLGDLAIRYGYQRFETKIMFITVIILMLMVQIIQYLGEKAVQFVEHR